VDFREEKSVPSTGHRTLFPFVAQPLASSVYGHNKILPVITLFMGSEEYFSLLERSYVVIKSTVNKGSLTL
jgi:hypothetical protein